MWNYILIGFGGALGSIMRFWLSNPIAPQVGGNFPWGTLVVNVSGSLVIGFVATYLAPESRSHIPPEIRQLIMIGILGGYTTFSAFSLQTLNLILTGNWLAATGNVIASVLLCLAAVWLGHVIALAIN